MKKLHLIFLALILLTKTSGQTLVGEFNVTGRVQQIQTFSVDDSVFITFLQKVRQSYWINKDGIKREVQLMLPETASLIEVQPQLDGTISYYYFDEVNEQLVLRAMNQGHRQPQIERELDMLVVPGQLLGYRINENETHVVCYAKPENEIRIISLERLSIKHETVSRMPFDISRHVHHNMGLIADMEMAGVEQGDPSSKLYWENNHLILTIDENKPGMENKKTTVIKIDNASGAMEMKQVARTDYDRFTSFYTDNMIYQIGYLPRRHMTLRIVDVASAKVLLNKTFEKKSMGEHKVITRRGSRVELSYSTFKAMVGMGENLPAIVVQHTMDPTVRRIIMASIYHEPLVEIIPIPLATFSLLIPIPLGPSNSNATYFTLEGNPETGFELEQIENNPNRSLRHRIDKYEISQTTGRPKDVKDPDFDYKNYMETNDGVYAMYYQREGKFTLMKYKSEGGSPEINGN